MPSRGNVFPPILGLVGIGCWSSARCGRSGPPTAVGLAERLALCVSIADDHARLACYDKIAALRPPAKGRIRTRSQFTGKDRNEQQHLSLPQIPSPAEVQPPVPRRNILARDFGGLRSEHRRRLWRYRNQPALCPTRIVYGGGRARRSGKRSRRARHPVIDYLGAFSGGDAQICA